MCSLTTPVTAYPTWTYGREAATRRRLNLKSVKKINMGNCQPIVLACSVIMNIWQPLYNSFSGKQLEIMACDRSFPPVGPSIAGCRGKCLTRHVRRWGLKARQRPILAKLLI
jgi:hypothetical protein